MRRDQHEVPKETLRGNIPWSKTKETLRGNIPWSKQTNKETLRRNIPWSKLTTNSDRKSRLKECNKAPEH